MSTLGERLRAARERAGLSQKEVAAQLGLKHASQLSNWERDYAEPSANALIALARILDADLRVLMDYYGGEGPQLTLDERGLIDTYHALDDHGRRLVRMVADAEYERCTALASEPPSVRPINLLTLPVSAGPGIELQDSYAEPINIPLTAVSKRADFALRISGDSMEPDYQDGDLILIRQTPVVEPGTLGVFGLDGHGFFKRLGQSELISLNPDYAPMPLNETFLTFGEVLGKTREI